MIESYAVKPQFRTCAKVKEHKKKLMQKDLHEKNRAPWVQEDLARLLSPATYQSNPEKLLLKIKFRSPKKIHYARAFELVKQRESLAISLNKTRQSILKDEAIAELAAFGPQTVQDLKKLRSPLPIDPSSRRH